MLGFVLEGKLYVTKWFSKSVEGYTFTSYEMNEILQLNTLKRRRIWASTKI